MVYRLTHILMRLLTGALLIGSVIACSGPESAGSSTADDSTQPAQGEATRTSASTSVATESPGSSSVIATATEGDSSTATVTRATSPTTAPSPSPSPSPTITPTSAPEPSSSLLPGNRIVSYYGHPNSAQMGILGEYTKEELLALLQEQGAAFEAADPSHPVVLAFELIATVAQPFPGDDGTYVAWTDDELIQEYVDFATANGAIVILDLQIGHDTIEHQIESIRKWLELPNVHVALDPEFSMKANETVPRDRIPGEFIGEVNGHDVQRGIEMLAQLVAEKQLPAKMLIIHQFEQEMIYNKEVITPLPGVDVVLDMDGFGGKEAKLGNYGVFVTQQLIEYGGIKLFYKQDDPLLMPEELVVLDPPPLVIIYQ